MLIGTGDKEGLLSKNGFYLAGFSFCLEAYLLACRVYIFNKWTQIFYC